MTQMKIRLSSLRAVSLAAVVLVAACGKKADAPETQAPAGTTDLPAASSLQVSDIDLGKRLSANKEVEGMTDDFGVRDTIAASVKVDGSATGATVTARWMFEDGQLVEEQNETISPSGTARAGFRIMKASAWPTGKYKLVVMLNGQEAKTEEFEIK
ncbi:MAG: hypothetical protein H7Z74_13245 [Anaerolineae bacterium]|nr:hypothetical protein [Gemmatimonadaceae bacterium]